MALWHSINSTLYDLESPLRSRPSLSLCLCLSSSPSYIIQYSHINYRFGISVSSSSLHSFGSCMLKNHPKCNSVSLCAKHSLHYVPTPTLWYSSVTHMYVLLSSKCWFTFWLLWKSRWSVNTGIGFCLISPTPSTVFACMCPVSNKLT